MAQPLVWGQGFQALIGIEKSQLSHRPLREFKISRIRFCTAREKLVISFMDGPLCEALTLAALAAQVAQH